MLSFRVAAEAALSPFALRLRTALSKAKGAQDKLRRRATRSLAVFLFQCEIPRSTRNGTVKGSPAGDVGATRASGAVGAGFT